MNAISPKQSHYPALDGLRGVAILLVVFLHNFGFMNYFFFGWLGVDLFFVLSGFLITDILLNSLGKSGFLRNFYARRILRIFPLYYVTLIICLLILPQIKSLNLNLTYYTTHQFWIWTYMQNWLFIFQEPYGSKIILHFWSLAIEEQFYLFWPIIILLVRKPKKLLIIVVTVLIIVGITRFLLWTYKIEDLAYASLYTFTRIDGICVGCMVALLLRIDWGFLKKYTTLIILFLAAINFGFYFFNTEHSFTLPYLAFVGYTTFAMLFGILVNEAVTGNSRIIKFVFENKVLKFFGKISYGFYIFHWPVYVLGFSIIQKKIAELLSLRSWYTQMISAIIVTLLALLLSIISYHFFEKFFNRMKENYK